MVTTIKELATLAGVTETTVSLAFQDGSRISDETRKRIMVLARRVGYVPNLAARRLRQWKKQDSNPGYDRPGYYQSVFCLYDPGGGKGRGQTAGTGFLISDSQWQASEGNKRNRDF